MPALHTYKIFISHAWGYNDEYYRLIGYLDAAPNFSYSNYSVPSHDGFGRLSSEQLGEKLRHQMCFVEVVLVLAGMYAAHSAWIQYEINHARTVGKPIVGVKPWGAVRVPSAVQNAVDEMVGWNTSSIVDAIRRHA